MESEAWDDKVTEIRSEVEEAFAAVDTNNDGVISVEEAKSFGLSTDDFAAIDSNGDGVITQEELFQAAVADLCATQEASQVEDSLDALTRVDHSNMTPDQLKREIKRQVKDVVVNRSGISFEERSALASAKFKKEALAMERRQQAGIQEAIRRGRERPNSSAIREKSTEPESIESRSKRGVQALKSFSASNLREMNIRIKEVLDNKPPLFSLAEVEAAQQMLKERQAQRKRELTEEEAERWKMLGTMQAKVLFKPLSMEQFRKNAVSATDLKRMANPKERPMGVDLKIQIGMEKKSFTQSAWAAEVKNIRRRADSRPGLHEISYPKVDPVKPPCRPKIPGPLEKLIEAAIQAPSFKNSKYASEDLAALKEKMNTREKLHEISYPPKPWRLEAQKEKEMMEAPSALALKIQANMNAVAEVRGKQMAADARKQRRLLNDAIADGLAKRAANGGVTRPPGKLH